MYYYYHLVYCSSVWVGLTNDSRFGPSILPGSNNLKPTFGRLYHPMAMLCRCDRGFTNRNVNWMGTLQVLNYRLVVLSCKVFISARAAPKSNFLTEVWRSAVEVSVILINGDRFVVSCKYFHSHNNILLEESFYFYKKSSKKNCVSVQTCFVLSSALNRALPSSPNFLALSICSSRASRDLARLTFPITWLWSAPSPPSPPKVKKGRH